MSGKRKHWASAKSAASLFPDWTWRTMPFIWITSACSSPTVCCLSCSTFSPQLYPFEYEYYRWRFRIEVRARATFHTFAVFNFWRLGTGQRIRRSTGQNVHFLFNHCHFNAVRIIIITHFRKLYQNMDASTMNCVTGVGRWAILHYVIVSANDMGKGRRCDAKICSWNSFTIIYIQLFHWLINWANNNYNNYKWKAVCCLCLTNTHTHTHTERASDGERALAPIIVTLNFCISFVILPLLSPLSRRLSSLFNKFQAISLLHLQCLHEILNYKVNVRLFQLV